MNNEILDRIDVLTPLLLAYPKSGMTADNIEVYAKTLTIVGIEVLKVAVFKCMRTYKFFPSIFEIMAQVESLTEEILGKEYLSSDEAWFRAMKEVKTKADFLDPEIEDVNVAEAVKLFGWHELHMIREDEVGIARAQFKKIYEGICSRRKEKQLNQQMLGGNSNILNGIGAGLLKNLPSGEGG